MVDIYKDVKRNSGITVESTKMMVFNSFTAANNYFLYLNLFCKKLLNLVLILFMNMSAK